MRNRRKSGDDTAEPDMTPMLDVVFILLIFFIVTSTFLNEVGFDQTPPPPSDQPPPKVKSVNIFIDSTNLIQVDGRTTDINAVRANIERKKAENPNISVAIVADADARNQYVVEVYDLAKQANVESVNVAQAAY